MNRGIKPFSGAETFHRSLPTLMPVIYLLQLVSEKNIVNISAIPQSQVNILPQKFIFSRRGEKNCEKVSPYFSHPGVEKFPKQHFFGKNFSRLALFWQKFAIFGGKLLILGGKSIKIGIFWVKSFPPLIFFPPPYFYLAEYSPMILILWKSNF